MARTNEHRAQSRGTSLAWVALVALVLAGTGTAARAQGQGGGGGGGGEEEGLGNNLSTPVVFAEGQGITGLPTAQDTGLRPRPGETNPTLPYFDASTVVVKDGVTYYPQQSESTWQAGWLNGLGAPVQANISWGDNLLARTWNPKSVIRVETVLYQDAAAPLTAYTMASLFGEQRAEVFGTDTTTFASSYRTIYAVTPRLIIERITGPGGGVVPGLQRYEGSVAAGFEGEGPGRFGAEVNGAGRVIYGFNWTLPQWDMDEADKVGWWRITFTFDPVAKYSIPAEEEGGTAQSFTVARNVMLAGLDPADLGDEFTYRPTLVNQFTSVLEIEVILGSGGTGGGGGGGGGGSEGGGEEPEEPVDPNDVDADGLPDVWEDQFGIDTTAKNATADPDGDGLTNEEEYLAGSHPMGIASRYFAEGVTGNFFTTRLTLLNTSHTTTATTLIRFLTAAGTTVSQIISLPPLGHQLIDVGSIAGLEATAFSTVVEADTRVVVERTTTWDDTGYGSHATGGVEMPATAWYLAEGATHSGFQLFYLIGNAGGTAAEVQVQFLRPAPLVPIVKTYTVPARSRRDIWVNVEDAELAATDVSAVITSTAPVIVERSMYLNTGGLLFAAGTSSAASTGPATTWYFAEGAIGDYFDTYVLLLNPGTTDATVRTTYLLPSGATVVANHVVAAGSRYGVWVDVDPQMAGETTFSTVVESTNGVPVVAERAMWWPGSDAAAWLDGHTAPGASQAGSLWALAGPGEVGGDTYLMMQNTSAFAGVAEVTVSFDGTTASTFVALPALSRQTIAIDDLTFPGVAGKSFGVIVQSQGTTPAEIVVERATYVTVGGVHWAAGSAVAATRLQ